MCPPACGLSVFSVRMHYLIAPYLLGNHFQTRARGFWRREGGEGGILLFASSGDFSSMRVCGDAENGPNVRGGGAKEGRRGDRGMRGGPSNTLIKTQSHIQALSSNSKG